MGTDGDKTAQGSRVVTPAAVGADAFAAVDAAPCAEHEGAVSKLRRLSWYGVSTQALELVVLSTRPDGERCHGT